MHCFGAIMNQNLFVRAKICFIFCLLHIVKFSIKLNNQFIVTYDNQPTPQQQQISQQQQRQTNIQQQQQQQQHQQQQAQQHQQNIQTVQPGQSLIPQQVYKFCCFQFVQKVVRVVTVVAIASRFGRK